MKIHCIQTRIRQNEAPAIINSCNPGASQWYRLLRGGRRRRKEGSCETFETSNKTNTQNYSRNYFIFIIVSSKYFITIKNKSQVLNNILLYF